METDYEKEIKSFEESYLAFCLSLVIVGIGAMIWMGYSMGWIMLLKALIVVGSIFGIGFGIAGISILIVRFIRRKTK